MTGIPASPGAPAPTSTPTARDPRLTRTRRAHGFFNIGGTTASVHSSRRNGDALGVSISVGADALQFTGAMSPVQARGMAKALSAAADAVERQQGGAR